MLGCLNRAKRPASRAEEKNYLIIVFQDEKYQHGIMVMKIDITNVGSSHTSGNSPLSHNFCCIQCGGFYFLTFSYNSKLTPVFHKITKIIER